MNLLAKKAIPLLIVVSLSMTSCAEFYGDVQVTNDPSNSSATPATSWEGNHTTMNFFWAPVPVNTLGEKTESQPDCVLHDVKVTQDFFQVVCSIVTLGGVKPANVQWQVGADPTVNNQTTCYFAWGLIPGDNPAQFQSTACGMHDIKVTQDFWQGLCGFATLGIIKPVNVQYKLGAAPARQGPSL
ncbi:MAG TPA: hypothetical protein VK791_10545 [bacterium]|jgi:hypothetical protein|nr:hypothetical protein [bacterium]